jgi:hypothetical protein
MSAGPGEQGGDTIDPDTGEFVDDSGGGGGGGGFDDDDTDTAEGAEDEFGSGGDYFNDEFDGSTGQPDETTAPSSGGGRDDDDDDDDSGRDTDAVPDFDGRKTTIRGPDAPGNESDSPQVIVDDRAGEDGQPARDPTDDAFVPDDREGLEDELGVIGEPTETRRQRVDEAVERLQADLSRAGGSAIVAGERDVVNIRERDGRLQATLTEQGLDELRGTTGERTVAGAPIGEPAISDSTSEPALRERDTPAGAGDEFVPPTRADPATLDEPGSAEQAADLRADEVVAPQEAFVGRDSLRDPTLVRGEAQARREAQLDDLGLGRTEAFGDADLSFGLGGPGDEVEQFTDEFVASGAEDVSEQTGLDQPFSNTRDAVNADQQSETVQQGLEPDPLTRAAFRIGSEAPDLPARGVEGVETGLFLTGGTPAAGGSEEEFDRRLEQISTAAAGRADLAAESAQQNPEQFAADFIVGSAAEAGAVGLLGRAARAGDTPTPSRRDAASQALDDLTPELRTRERSFLADERGTIDMTRDRVADASAEADDSIEVGEAVDEGEQAVLDLDAAVDDATQSPALEVGEQAGETASDAVDIDAAVSRELDVSPRFDTLATGVVAGPTTAAAQASQTAGRQQSAVDAVAEAVGETERQAQRQRATQAQQQRQTVAQAEQQAQQQREAQAQQQRTALDEALAQTEIQAESEAQTEAQRQRQRVETETRIEPRAETEVRVEPRLNLNLDTRLDVPGERRDGDDEAQRFGGFGIFSDEFTNPATTPEEFLDETFGGGGR